jgi:hypothetical protein
MEGRETGSAGKKKLEFTLSINMLKIIFLFLKAPQAFTKSPCCFFKR